VIRTRPTLRAIATNSDTSRRAGTLVRPHGCSRRRRLSLSATQFISLLRAFKRLDYLAML
jgi:hypothetical protein